MVDGTTEKEIERTEENRTNQKKGTNKKEGSGSISLKGFGCLETEVRKVTDRRNRRLGNLLVGRFWGVFLFSLVGTIVLFFD